MSPSVGAPRSTLCSPFARTSVATRDFFYTWQDVEEGALWPMTSVGDTIRVWIVDVGGTRLFIEAETSKQAGSDLEQEIRQIVESIRFD